MTKETTNKKKDFNYWLKVVTTGAAILMLIVWLVPAGQRRHSARPEADPLVEAYAMYLQQRGLNSDEILQRQTEIEALLKQITVADEGGYTDEVQKVCRMLAYKDSDRASPLYVYAVEKLKEQPGTEK